ncbi:DUF1501 domain-containing protein [Thalassoglobus sp. JC818]|uniref:DUF1501 domain-containing protein n=1 Tax=Thalassoglobus sp. JC818 TaxID=3232136 RepID=UPI0034575176
MKCRYFCDSEAHALGRRSFMQAFGAGLAVGGWGLASQSQALAQLKSEQKRMLVVFLAGGVSQLETWDPKPKTDTGGPFRAIPTSVPGIHISELLPQTAKNFDKLSLIRSINSHNDDHGKGSYQMGYGRNQMPGVAYPHLGSVCAKALERQNSPLPGFLRIPGGGRGNDAAYLGPAYNSVGVNGNPLANSARHGSLSDQIDQKRHDFRRGLNDRFLASRRTAETEVYTESFEQALGLMERRDVFDVSKESAEDQARYGSHDFGKHCLMARRLLEQDVPFVQVSHSNYDTHNENFNFHLEQMAEFDTPFSNLITDLDDRGMMESTLVVVMSEFGRTPRINARYGRDHWGKSWSICLGGAGIQPGAVIGKTNENGTEVIDREVAPGDLFHTYLSAVGIDSSGTFDIDGRELPVADPAHGPISELIT